MVLSVQNKILKVTLKFSLEFKIRLEPRFDLFAVVINSYMHTVE